MNRHLIQTEQWEDLARRANFHPSTMAELSCISLRQLERFFIEHYNMSPGEWARELRCRLARELIAKGGRCKEVAIDLHYANNAHLCREFKSVYGLPPRTFAAMSHKPKV